MGIVTGYRLIKFSIIYSCGDDYLILKQPFSLLLCAMSIEPLNEGIGHINNIFIEAEPTLKRRFSKTEMEVSM
jgi:hypothetical protein